MLYGNIISGYKKEPSMTTLPFINKFTFVKKFMNKMKHLRSMLFKQSSLWNHVPVRFGSFYLPLHDRYNGFDNSINQIIDEVRKERKYLHLIPKIENKIQLATKFNVAGGNNISSRTMLHSFEMIENPENITAETINQAFVLAWAAQMTEAHQKISEEAKFSPTASKQKHSEVAVKDGNLLRSFMYAMLEQKFQNTNNYRDILQLFNKAFLYGVISQYQNNPINITNKCANINSSYYQMLCDYKVSYIYFELPLLLAMKLSNKTDVNLQENVHNICSQMGMLYQIQEDFQNCFGDETIIGTEGTDIQEGKCTWLAVTALQRFTPHQRIVFEACYGSDEPAHIERVKLLYKQMQLDQLFREEEGALYESIMQRAEMLEKSGIPCKLFENLLEAIRNPS